jgi:hypothetical protein
MIVLIGDQETQGISGFAKSRTYGTVYSSEILEACGTPSIEE